MQASSPRSAQEESHPSRTCPSSILQRLRRCSSRSPAAPAAAPPPAPPLIARPEERGRPAAGRGGAGPRERGVAMGTEGPGQGGVRAWPEGRGRGLVV